jgi:hypothetical protein
MKNKLLISSALVSGLMVGGSAIAQTSYNADGVTGSLDLHYRAQGYSAASGLNSNEQMGRESQLNIAKSGKLNNGWDYKAGFSLEFDGNARNVNAGQQKASGYRTVSSSLSSGVAASVSATTTGVTNSVTGTVSLAASADATEANSIANENVFIDLINTASGTTLTFGVDHIQNITQTAVPQVMGNTIDNVAVGMSAKATNTMGSNPKESIGFGIIQDLGTSGIKLSGWYAPNSGDFGTTDQGSLAQSQANGTRNSAYEVGFTGANTFGVTGLTTRAFMNKEVSSAAGMADITGSSYGIGYVTGAFGIGVEQHKQNRITDTAILDQDMTVRTYGLTYAVSPQVTIGVVRLATETATLLDEKIDSFQLGYNLGPVAIVGAYSKGSDIGGVSGADIKEGAIRLSTKF